MMSWGGGPPSTFNAQWDNTQFYLDGIGGDSISAYSGAAETPIKIGPTLKAGGGLELGLTLHYSSKIWHRHNVGVNNVYNALTRRGPFGVGWRLHVGRLYHSSTAGLVYESPDGAQHPIKFGVQTPDPNSVVDPNIIVTYNGTTDSTYMRVEPMAGSTPVAISGPSSNPVFTPAPDSWRVYMGNGVVHTLARNLESVDANHNPDPARGVDDFHGYYTTKIEKWADPNAANDPNKAIGRIAISYDASAPHCIDQIDFLARDPNGVLVVQRSITFTNDTELDSWEVEGGYTKAITFPAVNGQSATTATYDFEYEGPVDLTFTPNSDSNWNIAFDDQFLLKKILLPFPDPNHRAEHPHEFTYDLDPNAAGKTGELLKRSLPTGAVISYKHDSYAWGNEAVTNFSREVVEKNIYLDPFLNPNVYLNPDYDPNIKSDGKWTYERVRGSLSFAQYAVVKDPFGNDTVYHFTNGSCSTPGQCPGSLTTTVETYRGQNAYVLVQTNRVAFLNVQTGINIQPSHEWTIHHDHQNKTVHTLRGDVGPFGHFGFIKEYGFNQAEEEEELLDESIVPYRQVILTYEKVDPNTVALWKLWSIDRLTSRVIQDGTGLPLRRSTMNYTDDGRVLWTRSHLVPSDPNGGSDDIKTENIYDSITANLERSYTHKAGAATPGFGSRFEYTGGVFLTKSRTLDPNQPTATSSQAFSYLEKELVRDSVSGSVKWTFDSNGLRTDHHVDRLGRPTSIVPTSDSGALSTVISYSNQPIQSQPKWFEIVTNVEQGSDPNSPAAYARQGYRFDRLGRVVEVRRRIAANCDSIQQTRYDIAGRVTFVTEWGFDAGMSCPSADVPATQIFDPNHAFDPNHGMETFYNLSADPTKYDPLGRVQKVVTADGSVTRSSYAGPVTTVTVEVDGQEADTRYEYDAFGNLVYVDAPDDPNTPSADARYTYSITGELLKAETISTPASGSPVIQERTFSYDTLGRLKSSTTPEGGTIQVNAHDVAGRPLQRVESDGTKVTITYDAAGRILTSFAAEDITNSNATLPRTYAPARDQVKFYYDESGVSNAAGRLTRIDSYDESGDLIMRRKLNYAGRMGRLSEESSTFAAWDGRGGIGSLDKELRTCYFYDNLGMVSEFRYPAESTCSAGSAPAGVARLLYSYRFGSLDKIEDAPRCPTCAATKLLDGVTYNAAGGPRKIIHGNGLATSIWPDIMGRPSSISVLTDPNGTIIPDPNSQSFLSNTSLFRTGLYAYDEVGNILSIGPGTDAPNTDPNNRDRFSYDRLSRLVSAKVFFKDASNQQQDDLLTYKYDAFGNLTEWIKVGDSTADLDTSIATNRLESVNNATIHYEQTGNLLGGTYDPNQPSDHYLFDERNRLLAAGISNKTYPVGQYAYDAGGMRFMKSFPGTGERIFYVRDSVGNVLTELTLPPAKHDESFQKDYFYALGRVIGMAEEKAPAPVEGLWGSSNVFPGNEEEEIPLSGSVTLNWANPGTGVAGYRVFRRKVGGTGYAQVGSDLAASATSYSQIVTPGQLQPEATYYYKVAAFNSSGLEGIPSRSLKFTMTQSQQPAAPSGLAIEAKDRSLTLRWARSSEDSGFLTGTYVADPASNFQGYQVYRQNALGNWVKRNLLPLTEPVFHDLAVTPGTTYTYQIRAIDTYWQESAGTTNVTGQPADYDPPAPPTGVRALSGPGTNQITIVWNASPESDVQEYKVYEKVSGSYSLVATIGDPNHLHTYLHDPNCSAAEHTFAVAAKDLTSYSGLSPDVKGRLRNALGVPGSQAATRFMRWSDHVPSAWIVWENVSQATKYRLYRANDLQSWSDYQLLGVMDPNTQPYKDYSVESCSAYTYMVRAVDPNGYESADPNGELLVERIMRPNAPIGATGVLDPNTRSITLSWGDFMGNCQEGADGFTIEGWVIKTSPSPTGTVVVDESAQSCGGADPNFFNPSKDIVINNPDINSCTFTYPTTIAPRPFAIVAKLKNTNHSDPNDPHELFDSFISADICIQVDPATNSPVCADLSGNNPPPGWGGGGGCEIPEDCEEREGEILYRPHPGHASFRSFEVEDDLLMYLAQSKPQKQGTDTCQVNPEDRIALQSLDAPGPGITASARQTAEPELVSSRDSSEMWSDATGAMSPYRVIGAPSAKEFKFYYFHHDHLGSVRLVTDASKAKVSGSKFLPFGEEAVASTFGSNTHRFTGHEQDPETGMAYMKARYYSNAQSRFLGVDPLPGTNLYSYASANPMVLVDPSGMAATAAAHSAHFNDDMASMNQMKDDIAAWQGTKSSTPSSFAKMLDIARANSYEAPEKPDEPKTDGPTPGIPTDPFDPGQGVARGADPRPPKPGEGPTFTEVVTVTSDFLVGIGDGFSFDRTSEWFRFYGNQYQYDQSQVYRVGKTIGPWLWGAVAKKSLQVDGPLGTRIVGVRLFRYFNVIRLDYGPWKGTGGVPMLHLHIGPIDHIPIDRKWYGF